MASTSALPQPQIQPPFIQETISPKSMESRDNQDKEVYVLDYSKRAPWLRAAVLGANNGLFSTASLMMGIGAVRKGIKSMILTGIAGVVGGACSVAIEMRKKNLHCPLRAAGASALSFAVGATVPLVWAAAIKKYEVRLGVVIAVVSLALLLFGALAVLLGGAPVYKLSFRWVVGGWAAMVITFGLTKVQGLNQHLTYFNT